MTSIEKAIDRFLSLNELGKTDSKNLNKLVRLLEDGKVETERAVQEIYANAKNPGGSFRNFLKRVRKAIKKAAGNQEDRGLKDVLESLKIITHQKTAFNPGCISIEAHSEPIGNLPDANRQYNSEQFVFSEVSNVGDKPVGENDLKLFFSYSKPIGNLPDANRQYNSEQFVFNEVSNVDDKPVDENDLKLFISYANENARLANELARMLEQRSEGTEKPIRNWKMLDLLPGQDFVVQIREKLAESDFGLGCLSQAFLNSQFIAEEEVSYLLQNDKLLLAGLDSRWGSKDEVPKDFFALMREGFQGEIPEWKKKIRNIEKNYIYHLRGIAYGAFWGQCVEEEDQERFVDNLIKKIQEVMEQRKEREKNRNKELEKSKDKNDPDYSPERFVSSEAQRTLMLSPTEKVFLEERKRRHREDAEGEKQSRPSRELVPDMLNWAKDGKEPVYTILGDYGMGKTFNCRIFAQHLVEARKNDSSLPIPLYMDLREVQTFVEEIKDGIVTKRLPLLSEMIAMVLRKHEIRAVPEKIIEDVRQGRVLPIFDGLDEKLVYYTSDTQNQYLDELMKVFPSGETRDKSKVRMVLSCRRHHFETIDKQSGFLRGLHRSDAEQGDYRAMEILPLSDGKMRQLLEKKLGKDDAFRVWNYIDGEEYLAALGRRPLLLSKLPDFLPVIQSMQADRIPVNAAVFYKALVDHVLNRDDPKHVLKNRHKHRLLQDLALYFWENSEQRMNIDNLNDWYQTWLRRDRDMFAQYETEGSEQLEKDLRNSSLLLRFGQDEFGFTHSSMQEYFLARKLLSQWIDVGYSLAKPVSSLTEQFIGELLVLLKDGERRKLHEQLASYAARPEEKAHSPHQDALLLRIIRSAADAGQPFETFEKVHVFGADMSGEKLRGIGARKLVLTRCQMLLCRWQECRIDELALNETNINQSVWEECQVTRTEGKQDAQRLTCVNTKGPIPGLFANRGGRIYPGRPMAPVSPLPYAKNHIIWGHREKVNSVAFSPNGRLLASGSYDNTLRLWSAEGECLAVMEGHSSGVNSVVFSPDGRLLASGSYDNTLRLWSAEGECLAVMEGHSSGVHSVAFSPDGRLLASGSDDNTLRLWSAEGECLAVMERHSNWVWSVAFSPDGRLLASGSNDNTLRLWSAQGECLAVMEGHSSGVHSVAFSPDGRLLASGSDDKTLRLWSAEGECLAVMEGHSSGVNSVAFSPDGRLLASGSYDKTLRLWSVQGECLAVMEGHSSKVNSVAFSPDGRLLASGSYDKTLRLWSVQGECLAVMEGHSSKVNSVAFSPDGRLLAPGSDDNTLRLWSAQGECLAVMEGHSRGVNSVAFSPDGRLLASGSYDNTLRLWSAEGECLAVMEGHSNWVWSVAFSPDGRLLASGSYDKTLRLWSAEGECLAVMKGHSNWVWSVAFSPDGRLLASGSSDASLRLWSAQGECLAVMEGHSNWVRSVAFSPDGRLLASGSSDKTLRLWSAEGECLAVMEGHSLGVNSVAFSPDGRLLASGSDDNTLRLWSAEGECLAVMEGHSSGVNSVAFSPDGRLLASGSDDGTQIIWALDRSLPSCIMSTNPDGQWWSLEIDENGRYTRLLGTELAWQRVRLRHKDGAASLDAFEGFQFVPSRHCLK